MNHLFGIMKVQYKLWVSSIFIINLHIVEIINNSRFLRNSLKWDLANYIELNLWHILRTRGKTHHTIILYATYTTFVYSPEIKIWLFYCFLFPQFNTQGTVLVNARDLYLFAFDHEQEHKSKQNIFDHLTLDVKIYNENIKKNVLKNI